jgi:hypothetical protein
MRAALGHETFTACLRRFSRDAYLIGLGVVGLSHGQRYDSASPPHRGPELDEGRSAKGRVMSDGNRR